MKKLLVMLGLFLIVGSSCHEKQSYPHKTTAASNVVIQPELYHSLIRQNPAIDTVQFNLLINAGFSEEKARQLSFTSNIDFVKVSDTAIQVQNWKAASAQLSGDTLSVFIKSTPVAIFGSGLIEVSVTGNRFTSKYYSDTDLGKSSEDKAAFNRLTLNTNKFYIGDTIAGKLFFRSEDTRDGIGGKYTQYASGDFRAIVQ
ncbi:MAG: hypothetical protein LPK19_10280 [Hymenobacteraceae bacterium]|nr:hypothetical protein [Hymenobacteraceae bacterium]MDX5396610.1 hypothetical protein [Hymenobacteraceae bacterium]MDX5512673.1 hypothetical protein [Hymenobacteraceae bacterium]